MITHQIKKYLTKYKSSTYNDDWPGQYTTHGYQGSRHWPNYTAPKKMMGKLEFAMAVKNSGLKRGMFVVHKLARPPYTAYQVFQIDSIDEIHRLVQQSNNGPLCLNFLTFSGTLCKWKGGLDEYIAIDAKDVPPTWESTIVDV